MTLGTHPPHDLLKLLLEMAAPQLEFDGFGFCQVVAPVLETVFRSMETLNIFFTVSSFVLVLHPYRKHSSDAHCITQLGQHGELRIILMMTGVGLL
jgi:hypothetical protein